MPDYQAIVKLIQSKAKHSHPWTRQERFNQPFFEYDTSNDSWRKANPSGSRSTITSFRVLSWNIDFMLPYTSERMQVALDHLNSLVKASDISAVIFLNEMLVSDLELIQAQNWIREAYYITDVDDTFWESGHYGTVTLTPRIMNIKHVFRVHYEATRMERDGLFVDIDVGQEKILRLCNSHLESLVAEPPLRPKQVETAAQWMHDATAAVIGGDFNAIQDFDRTLHSDNGLKDAYLELGGGEDSEQGYTWGQMAAVAQRDRFGCSRMDKLFFCGAVKATAFETFGMGVKVDDTKIERLLIEDEGLDGGWVTDHLGVMGTFEIDYN